MADTDIVVREASVAFHRVQLDHPFTISGRTISWFTLARTDVTVTDRRGRAARGYGASILSVPWAWPDSIVDVERRDAAMRELTEQFAAQVPDATPADPIAIWCRLHDRVPETMPRLAALLCLGSVDNALHDAWARAANRPAHTMYTKEHLAADVGACLADLGAREDLVLAGRYPGEFLTVPRRRLPVQHVVGVADPLHHAGAGEDLSVAGWLARDGARHVKIKLSGSAPAADARRIADVYAVASARPGGVSLAVDPNEGCPDPATLGELLDVLRATAPDAFDAVAYIEQPFRRTDAPDPRELRRHSRGKPVLMDEGLDDLRLLPGLAEAGWSGAVVKAGKGQSVALLTHAFARAHRLFVTVQDLTAVDVALAHSARLASVLDVSSPAFECNSRQYAPGGNRELAARYPDLVTARDGTIALPDPAAGIY